MERYIDLPDGKIFVDTYGNEEHFPLVLLHGNSEDSSYFIRQIEYFSDKFYVIAIDSRAHGKSSYNGEKLTIEKLADDTIKVLDIMGISKANFLGFSDGGNILVAIALKRPELINKMILNGSNLNVFGVKFRVNLQVYSKYFALCIKALFNDDFKQAKAVWKLMINQPKFNFEMIKKIKKPTLVIVGEKDMIKDSHSKKIANNIDGGELLVMEGSHFIAEENPLDFNDNIEKFLNKKVC